MPTLRRGTSQSRIAARPGQPAILLDSESPYASRRAVVECDGTTGPIAATWIANHQRAPAAADLARLDSGQAPEMPAAHTRHPDGTPQPEPQSLRALWLEEGGGG